MKNPEIDLVLMDIKIPVINGYEATRIIKEIRPQLPIIAQTAFTTKDDVGKAKAAGCDDHISKPISSETLQSALIRLLNEKEEQTDMTI